MRAFIAVNLPPFERQRLHDSLAPLRDEDLPVRWTAPESLHITLKFLGRIDEEQTRTVRRVLGEVVSGFRAFELEIAGIGAFPGLARPRVWWVGVGAEPTLLAIQPSLEAALEQTGFPREARAYSPHVTIGRAKERSRIGARADAFLRSYDFTARVPVQSVDLMESRPSPRGAQYERVLLAPLMFAPES